MAGAGPVAAVVVGIASLAVADRAAPVHTALVTATNERLIVRPAAVPLGPTVFVFANRSPSRRTFSVGRLRRSVAAGRRVSVRALLSSPGAHTIVSWARGDGRRSTGVLNVYTPCLRPQSTTVQVRMDHGRSGIALSHAPIPCGLVTFVVTNAGAAVDSFQIAFDGYPRTDGITPELAPGQTARLHVDFRATGAAYYQSGVYPPGEPEFGGTDDDGGRVEVTSGR